VGSRRGRLAGGASRTSLYDSLERTYERLGVRYLPFYISVTVVACVVIVLVAVIVFSFYQSMSNGQFVATLAFAEAAILGSLGLGAWSVMRHAQPIQQWLRGGRPAEGAETAWRLALSYAAEGIRTQFALAVVLVAVPVTLFVHWEFVWAWPRSGVFFVGVIVGASYPTMISFYLTEIVLEPLIRDAARALPEPRDAPAGIPLRSQLLLTLPLIGLVTSGFASVVGTIASGRSINQLGDDVVIGIVVTSTTSLLLAWLVARALLGPISELISATRRLRAGDLSVRVPVIAADELGMLIANFNQMVDALADRDALRARATQLELDAERLERQSEHATLNERARIARELHDVIAHNVGMIVLQAEGAGSIFDRDPERARTALDTIAGSGRQALGELRELLGVLRRTGEMPLTPQPFLRDVELLVASTREAGLNVELTLAVEGEIPHTLELAAYRIVQEALTNVVKHAGASLVLVDLRTAGARLEVSIGDDGVGPPPRNRRDGGHGLVGMRERAALLGGTLHAGPGPKDRGFVVSAQLPIPPSDLERADVLRLPA
jgi:signal transduction histidine kinase